MLYELMKKAYLLDRKDKELLFKNIDNIEDLCQNKESAIESNSKKKNKKDEKKFINVRKPTDNDDLLPSGYDHLSGEFDSDAYNPTSFSNKDSRIVTANRLFDPETIEQMSKLISLMEKHLRIDGDISYENVCVFLQPLINGSQKLVLRPYRLVGITKRMMTISKKYSKAKEIDFGKKTLDMLKKEFNKGISECKQHLSTKDTESLKRNVKLRFKNKMASSSYENMLRNSLINLKEQGMSMTDSINQVRLLANRVLSYNIEDDILFDIASDVFLVV